MTAINSLDDLRPGDLMLCGQATAPTSILVNLGQLLLRDHFRIGEFVAGHVAVVIPGGKIVEAMPSGARVRHLTASDWSPKHAYLRLPEDYPGQALDAAAVATAMVGIRYSFMSYVYLAAYLAGFKFNWLAKRIDRRLPGLLTILPTGKVRTLLLPVEAICSVLAEQAWTLTGKMVIHGTRPQVVTPGMLARQLWTRTGVIRGGAGFPTE